MRFRLNLRKWKFNTKQVLFDSEKSSISHDFYIANKTHSKNWRYLRWGKRNPEVRVSYNSVQLQGRAVHSKENYDLP